MALKSNLSLSKNKTTNNERNVLLYLRVLVRLRIPSTGLAPTCNFTVTCYLFFCDRVTMTKKTNEGETGLLYK